MSVEVIGVVLVRNEDRFVEQAILNVAGFCDRIYAFDHVSTDRTREVLGRLARELDHLTVRRTSDTRDSHRPLEQYVGSTAWALGVDGDELYDPAALSRMRHRLEAGVFDEAFHLKGHVLNCTQLDVEARRATGYLAPPSRPVTKLFNLGAADAWTGCPQRLHGGDVRFRPGYDWSSLRYVSGETDWDTDPLRMLHLCFLPRSSADHEVAVRRNLSETAAFRRGMRGIPRRLRARRAIDPRMKEYRAAGSSWKQEWYARGPVVSVDASPFLAARP